MASDFNLKASVTMKYEAYVKHMKAIKPDLYGNLEFDCDEMAWRDDSGKYYYSEKSMKRNAWHCCRDQHYEPPSEEEAQLTKEVEKAPIPQEVSKTPSKRPKLSRKTNKDARNFALERDGYKCVECGSAENLEVHHIVHRANGGTDDVENLVTLCQRCHADKHKGERIYNLMVSRFS